MLSFNNLGNLGRLANQMFQYSSLKGIARNRGFDFVIPPEEVFGRNDVMVKNDPLSLYTVFDLKEEIGMRPNPVLAERMHEFDHELFDSCPDDVDLFGYYQSAKYFEHIGDEIRNDFTFSNETIKKCQEIVDDVLEKKDAISIHIRRTDYKGNPNHPIQPLEYYDKALKSLPDNIPVVVFSDDPSWCHGNEFFADDKFIVSENNDADFDMCLMSKCKYHIIANSSFSWWGAWLADSEKVIAPKNWFAGDCKHKDTKDMAFGEWTWL